MPKAIKMTQVRPLTANVKMTVRTQCAVSSCSPLLNLWSSPPLPVCGGVDFGEMSALPLSVAGIWNKANFPFHQPGLLIGFGTASSRTPRLSVTLPREDVVRRQPSVSQAADHDDASIPDRLQSCEKWVSADSEPPGLRYFWCSSLNQLRRASFIRGMLLVTWSHTVARFLSSWDFVLGHRSIISASGDSRISWGEMFQGFIPFQVRQLWLACKGPWAISSYTHAFQSPDRTPKGPRQRNQLTKSPRPNSKQFITLLFPQMKKNPSPRVIRL